MKATEHQIAIYSRRAARRIIQLERAGDIDGARRFRDHAIKAVEIMRGRA